jgi:hypothetical protein
MSVTLLQQPTSGTAGHALSGTGVSSLTSSNASFGSNTTPGSLLLCVVASSLGYNRSGSTPAPIPTLNAPVTTGYSGPTWTLLASQGCNADYDSISASASAVAIYYIENAPSMASTATVTDTALCSNTTDVSGFAVVCRLWEFGGLLSSPLDTYATNSGPEVSAPPTTANLTTTGTDLIFVACSVENSIANIAAGSGYTAPSYKGPYCVLEQYILGIAPGSIPTAYASPGGPLSWAIIAAGFISSSVATLNFTVNGDPLVIPYELVAYQGATLTGANAYSCAPPIIRGIYQTPVFAHA